MTLHLNYPRFLLDPDARPLCAEVDPDLHFPEKGGDARKPKEICGGCEHVAPCLAYALENREPGVWGGTSESERRQILARRGRLPGNGQPINHGTEGGYQTHKRRGLPVDADDTCGCRAAAVRAKDARAKKGRAA